MPIRTSTERTAQATEAATGRTGALELQMRFYNTYAGVWCDYDNDGDLDLLTAGKSPFVSIGNGTYALHLYRNNGTPTTGLNINLAGGDCNRAAIGQAQSA